METKHLTINTANIILINYELGKGKIIVEDSEYYINASSFWGAMGSNIEEFIMRINDDYFANNLYDHSLNKPVDVKATLQALRKAIAEVLPWYKHLDFQKDMRKKINELKSSIHSLEQMYYAISTLSFDYYLIEHSFESDYVQQEIESIISEPGYLIETQAHPQYKYFLELHKQLKIALQKQQSPQLVANS